jgi:hypothetical protein
MQRWAKHFMDKKAKKRIEVLRKKITQLQQQLAGAKQQMDDPDEVRQYELQIAAAQEEIDKLKAS